MIINISQGEIKIEPKSNFNHNIHQAIVRNYTRCKLTTIGLPVVSIGSNRVHTVHNRDMTPYTPNANRSDTLSST